MTENIVQAIPVDREALRRYLFSYWLILHAILTVCLLGFWLPVAIVWIAFLPAYLRRYVADYEAVLTDRRLSIRHGVWWKTQKSIPLEKITDVVVSQGPLERKYGLSRILIQTAGTGHPGLAEGTLLGIREALKIQELIMQTREQAVRG